jgi:hypothetical protein
MATENSQQSDNNKLYSFRPSSELMERVEKFHDTFRKDGLGPSSSSIVARLVDEGLKALGF